MIQQLYFSQFTLILMAVTVVAVVLVHLDNKRKRNSSKMSSSTEPPRPRTLPIVGHLHLLGGYEVPYQAFSDLGKKYGDVISLKLGSVESVVINGRENIREVLVTKGHHFDSRPNFERYQRLFCGNRENSLAFCDWSDTQKIRREMLRAYTFPRAFTNKYNALDGLIGREVDVLVARVGSSSSGTELKPLVLQACANVFTSHFCSKRFAYDDRAFLSMIDNFDDIFYEVNQGYAADFLPFLMPLHSGRLRHMNVLTHKIRQFIVDNVIEKRFETWGSAEPTDYVESLVEYVKTDNSVHITWDMALFALEDIIGGHSAVGNFLVKLFVFLVNEPEVQRRIHEEVDVCTTSGARAVTIADRLNMPYTEAVIFEAIRLIASPIVPRVANQDSSVNGFTVKKDTVIFLNNYDLSMSDKLWDEPEKFQPERFIKDGRIVKPEHFLPFGGGRRSCIGYKIVQLVSFGLLAGLMQNYTVLPVDGTVYKVNVGCLAMPKKSFTFHMQKR